MTGQETIAGLREAVAAARKEAGRLLACLRHAAGLSQVRLAGQIGYSATVVAHAELGRRPVAVEFWELADEALGAGGTLTAWGTRIKDLTGARRGEQRRLDKASHAGELSRFLPPPGAGCLTTGEPAVLEPVITALGIGACPHCHQPVTLVTQINRLAGASTGPAG